MELVVLLGWVLLSVLAGRYAKSKGYGFATTFIASLLLSPVLGFLSVAVRSPRADVVESQAIASGEVKKCGSCAELVKAEAIKCRFCGEALAA